MVWTLLLPPPQAASMTAVAQAARASAGRVLAREEDVDLKMVFMDVSEKWKPDGGQRRHGCRYRE
jgi:hypothetical protein